MNRPIRHLAEILVLGFVLFCSTIDGSAQTNETPAFEWAKKMPFFGGSSIKTDNQGRLYVGLFRNGGTVGLAQLATNGDVLWTRDTEGYLLAVDSVGNYLTAQQTGVSSFDPSGAISWIVAYSNVSPSSAVIDDIGNRYITGGFGNQATLSGVALPNSGAFYSDVFIAKYDSGGGFQWVRWAGGPDSDVGKGIAVDSAGNVYVTGMFESTVNFGDTLLTSRGFTDVFVAKYASSGNLLWVKQAGGSGAEVGNSIAVDGNGNAFITGIYWGTAMFGDFALTNKSGGTWDIFVARLDNTGNFLWARSAGGAGPDYGNAISVGRDGSAYVTGGFASPSDFGGTTVTGGPIFVANYDSNGTLRWVQTARSLNSFTPSSQAIALDRAGNIFITGSFASETSFGGRHIPDHKRGRL